jgi:hypothetical protein
MRYLIAVITAALIDVPGLGLAQTQPTRPSAYATTRDLPSAFATGAQSPCYLSSQHSSYGYFNRASPCYSGTDYPSFSAIPPLETPRGNVPRVSAGALDLDEYQAKQRIEAKGYSSISRLERDNRGIWRGDAFLKSGRRVEVVLDLEGNIFSELVPPVEIWIRPKQ